MSRCARLRGAWMGWLAVLVCTVVLGCTPPGTEPGVEIWRFAIEEPLGSVQDAYAQRFKDLIETRSDGAIKVVVYPYGTVGNSDQVTELLRMGTLQFAMASPGHLGKLIPEVQVFLLHFVLTDDAEVNNRALSDPGLIDAINALYAEKGFRLLDIYSEGWMVWTTKKPVRTPEDFQGVKMRTMTSPLLLAAYEAYGASPTPLPYGEVYSALQLNMIDAQVNPVFAIQEMSFYEVTDYMIFPNHAPFVTTAVTNREFFESLAPEHQTLVQDVVEELHGYILDTQQAYNTERLDLIKERKPSLQIIEALTEAERQRFREASMKVRDQYAATAGPRAQQILDTLLEAVERAKTAP